MSIAETTHPLGAARTAVEVPAAAHVRADAMTGGVVAPQAVPVLEARQISKRFGGVKAGNVTGRILVADSMTAHNRFGEADRFVPASFTGATIVDGRLHADFPAKSITVLELE